MRTDFLFSRKRVTLTVLVHLLLLVHRAGSPGWMTILVKASLLCFSAVVEVQELGIEARKFQNGRTFSFLLLNLSHHSSLVRIGVVSRDSLSLYPLYNIPSFEPSPIVKLHDVISYLLRHCYPLLSGRFVVASLANRCN